MSPKPSRLSEAVSAVTSSPWVGLALMVVAAGLAWGWLLAPTLASVQARRGQLETLRAKIVDARLLTPELPASQATFKRVKEQVARLETRMGKGQAMARVLDTLRSEAGRCHVEITASQMTDGHAPSLPPIPLAPDLKLREVPVRVTVAGRYRQIGEFLGALSGAPFLSEVRGLTMHRKADHGSQLEAEMDLVVYLAS